MPVEETGTEFEKGMAALAADDTLTALSCFEKGMKLMDTPSFYSHLGYCLARERGQIRRGMQLCHEALSREPENPDHYLNLARVYLVAGDKQEALHILRQAASPSRENAEILRLLGELGMRKPPVFPFLPRSNPLNKYAGLILSRLKLR